MVRFMIEMYLMTLSVWRVGETLRYFQAYNVRSIGEVLLGSPVKGSFTRSFPPATWLSWYQSFCSIIPGTIPFIALCLTFSGCVTRSPDSIHSLFGADLELVVPRSDRGRDRGWLPALVLSDVGTPEAVETPKADGWALQSLWITFVDHAKC